MAKNIVKELIIILLLCLAIILVLGILLYEYVPMSKIVPEPVSYTTPEEVQKELLASGGVDESQVVMTYQVDSTDLNNYKRTQDYKPGKANPFSSYEQEKAAENTTQNNSQTSSGNSNTNSNNGTSNNSTSNGESSSQGQTNDNTSSGGKYFQDKGTK